MTPAMPSASLLRFVDAKWTDAGGVVDGRRFGVFSHLDLRLLDAVPTAERSKAEAAVPSATHGRSAIVWPPPSSSSSSSPPSLVSGSRGGIVHQDAHPHPRLKPWQIVAPPWALNEVKCDEKAG